MSGNKKRRSELGDKSITQLIEKAKKDRITEKRERTRAQYDLDPQVKQAIVEISTHESIPQSDIVEWALRQFIRSYIAGEVNLDPHLGFSNSLRYTHTIIEFPEHLDLPEKLEFEK